MQYLKVSIKIYFLIIRYLGGFHSPCVYCSEGRYWAADQGAQQRMEQRQRAGQWNSSWIYQNRHVRGTVWILSCAVPFSAVLASVWCHLQPHISCFHCTRIIASRNAHPTSSGLASLISHGFGCRCLWGQLEQPSVIPRN